MATITILPCPFCVYDDVELDEIGPENFAVICPECGCIGPNAELRPTGAGVSRQVAP